MIEHGSHERDEIMHTEDVERVTRVPAGTLRFYRATNVGPRCFKIGRRVVYRRSDVEEWVARQEAKSGRGGEQ
jgi:hypothetical protein